MNFGIIPSIGWIRFICVINAEPAIQKQSESLRRFAIMLMGFRNAVRKFEMRMVESVRIGKLLEFLIRKNFFDLAADWFIETIIIVDIEKTSGFKISSQTFSFGFGEIHITVSCQKEKWIIEDIIA